MGAGAVEQWFLGFCVVLVYGDGVIKAESRLVTYFSRDGSDGAG